VITKKVSSTGEFIDALRLCASAVDSLCVIEVLIDFNDFNPELLIWSTVVKQNSSRPSYAITSKQ
jgi:hypothetical protein